MLFTVLFIVSACQSNEKANTEKVEVETVKKVRPHAIMSLTTSDEISKDTFDVWRARWESNFRSYIANDSLHYFDMPLLDLTSIIINPNVDAARLYLGMAYDTRGAMMPHLMIMGTINGTPDNGVIMDYTTACPPMCN